MEHKRDIEDVENKIRSNELAPPQNEESKGLICDSPTHDSENRIREGNQVFVVATKSEDGWEVGGVTCWKCSVSNLIDTIDNDRKVAVVETRLRADENANKIFFENPEVWEFMSPAT